MQADLRCTRFRAGLGRRRTERHVIIKGAGRVGTPDADSMRRGLRGKGSSEFKPGRARATSSSRATRVYPRDSKNREVPVREPQGASSILCLKRAWSYRGRLVLVAQFARWSGESIWCFRMLVRFQHCINGKTDLPGSQKSGLIPRPSGNVELPSLPRAKRFDRDEALPAAITVEGILKVE